MASGRRQAGQTQRLPEGAERIPLQRQPGQQQRQRRAAGKTAEQAVHGQRTLFPGDHRAGGVGRLRNGYSAQP
ncbi:hypothetical protein D3C78_1873260 [compost metagenome]